MRGGHPAGLEAMESSQARFSRLDALQGARVKNNPRGRKRKGAAGSRNRTPFIVTRTRIGNGQGGPKVENGGLLPSRFRQVSTHSGHSQLGRSALMSVGPMVICDFWKRTHWAAHQW